MSWEQASSVGGAQCSDASGCLFYGGSLPDAIYSADAELPALVDGLGHVLGGASTWSRVGVGGATDERICVEPTREVHLEPFHDRWIWGFAYGLDAEPNRVKALLVRSADEEVHGWSTAPWGLPMRWATEWVHSPVGAGRVIGRIQLARWYAESECLVEARYDTDLPPHAGDIALYPRVRRWCGPEGPAVFDRMQSQVVEHPLVSPRTREATAEDPPATRVGAFGEELPHRAPIVAECAELTERPYCDSDLECAHDELCWWSRCVTRAAWSRLAAYRCHEGEVRYDVAAGQDERGFVTQVALDAPRAESSAFPFFVTGEGWTVASGLDWWGAHGIGSGLISYLPQAERPLYELDYRIMHQWLGFQVSIRFDDTPSDAPLPDLLVNPPGQVAVYVEARKWSHFGGCFEEQTTRHVFGRDGGESLIFPPESRILCAWPDHDATTHAANRAALARCDALWEAGERGEFAQGCAGFRDANARTWLRLWQIDAAAAER